MPSRTKRDAVDKAPYQCPTDPRMLKLLPEAPHRLRELGEIDPATLALSRGLVLQDEKAPFGGEQPELRAFEEKYALSRHFADDGSILWVEDPATKLVSPLWLRGEWGKKVKRLLDGKSRPEELPSDLRTALLAAGVLVPAAYLKNAAQSADRIFQEARAHLMDRGYAIVRRVFPPYQLAGLRAYLRHLTEIGYLFRDPQIVLRRYVAYNEDVIRFFHHQFTMLLNRISAQVVQPSYCIVARYIGGAVLPRHTDREQCAWNASLCLDSEPEHGLEAAWPLCMEAGGKIAEARLGIGDAVIYRGTDIPHWRDPLPLGRAETVAFFHFVPLSFEGSLY